MSSIICFCSPEPSEEDGLSTEAVDDSPTSGRNTSPLPHREGNRIPFKHFVSSKRSENLKEADYDIWQQKG